jgi:hypothetical protein
MFLTMISKKGFDSNFDVRQRVYYFLSSEGAAMVEMVAQDNEISYHLFTICMQCKKVVLKTCPFRVMMP